MAIALRWTAAAVLALDVAFYAGGWMIGVDSVALLLLLPPTAMSFLGVEMIRASLQGMLRFIAYGMSWLLWCAAQCVLGAIGLWLTRSPWGCFAGILVANLLTIGGLIRTVVDRRAAAPSLPADGPVITSYALRRAMGFCSAFVGLCAVHQRRYFSCLSVFGSRGSRHLHGIERVAEGDRDCDPARRANHSAGRHRYPGRRRGYVRAVTKAIFAAFALGAVAFCVLWAGSDLVCGAPHGIRYCGSPLMLLLAAAAVPLSVIRTLVTADVAHGRYWLPHLPYLAIVVFAAAMALTGRAGRGRLHLATTYLLSCWGLLLVWVAAGTLRGRFFPRGEIAPAALRRPESRS